MEVLKKEGILLIRTEGSPVEVKYCKYVEESGGILKAY